MSAVYKGMGGWEGGNRILMMPSDTGDQVVCTVGQTDGHSRPDNTTNHADIQWDRIGPKLPY